MKNEKKPTKKSALSLEQRAHLKSLSESLHGSHPNFMSPEDSKKMREDRKWEAMSESET